MLVKQSYQVNRVLKEIFLFALFLLISLTVLAQSSPATQPLGRDQGVFVYIGKEIIHGKLPYKDAWTNKPPAIFYLDAIGIWIGRGSRWGIWFVEMASLLVAIYVSYHLMENQWGVWPALFGLFLWIYGLDLTFYGGGNLTEEYTLPLHFIAIILMLRLLENPGKHLLNFSLGIIFAINFLFRANNAVLEAAAVVVLLIAQCFQKNYRNIIWQVFWIGVGSILPITLIAIYFWSQGILPDLLEASLVYNLTYSNVQLSSTSPLWTGFQILGFSVWMAIIGYFLIIYHIIRHYKGIYFYLFLMIGWPMVIYLSDPAKRNFAHYYINWLPFIALLGAFGLYVIQSKIPKIALNSSQGKLAGIIIFLVSTLIIFFWTGRANEYYQTISHLITGSKQGIELSSPTATYVHNHTKPGDLVLFWAALPGENYLSDREAPTASLDYPLYVRSNISTKLSDQFLQDLIMKTPVLIVDMGRLNTLSLDPIERQKRIDEGVGWPFLPDNINKVFDFIDEKYHLVAVIKNRNIYRLNGTD